MRARVVAPVTLRTGPGPNHIMITQLSPGDVLEVLQLDDQHEPSIRWHLVRVISTFNDVRHDVGKEGYAWAPNLIVMHDADGGVGPIVAPTRPPPDIEPPEKPPSAKPPKASKAADEIYLAAIIGIFFGLTLLGILWLLKP